MATRYYGVVKTNSVRAAGMMSPTIKVESKRDSKALRKKASDAFIKLLKKEVPERGAEAWLEVSRPVRSPEVIYRFRGEPTERGPSGAATGGTWTEVNSGLVVKTI